jgi:hypothetical protein
LRREISGEIHGEMQGGKEILWKNSSLNSSTLSLNSSSCCFM